MKAFTCHVCRHLIFFENVQCLRCERALGYLPDVGVLSALEPAADGEWRPLAPQAGARRYKMCLNYSRERVCNWLLSSEDDATLCLACSFNQTIPDLSVPENRGLWQRLEMAKRRLIYGLLGLGLPLINKQQDAERGLAFAFLAGPDPQFRETNAVMTGHEQGLITLDIKEADDAVRERTRLQMSEVYRSLLGHFRHESGHYYWERLLGSTEHLDSCRALFGDERSDYAQALQNHYNNGPPADWQDHFVSSYASAHPWEAANVCYQQHQPQYGAAGYVPLRALAEGDRKTWICPPRRQRCGQDRVRNPSGTRCPHALSLPSRKMVQTFIKS